MSSRFRHAFSGKLLQRAAVKGRPRLTVVMGWLHQFHKPSSDTATSVQREALKLVRVAGDVDGGNAAVLHLQGGRLQISVHAADESR